MIVVTLMTGVFPKKIKLKNGERLKLYVGDFAEISISGNGLISEDYELA